MKTQFIESNGQPEYAVVPITDYRALLEKAEMLEDIVSYDKAKADLAAGEDELIPAEVANALLDGVNPVKVWRKHRNISQTELAEKAGVSQAYIAQLETGKKKASMHVYRTLASKLSVDLEDLLD